MKKVLWKDVIFKNIYDEKITLKSNKPSFISLLINLKKHYYTLSSLPDNKHTWFIYARSHSRLKLTKDHIDWTGFDKYLALI